MDNKLLLSQSGGESKESISFLWLVGGGLKVFYLAVSVLFVNRMYAKSAVLAAKLIEEEIPALSSDIVVQPMLIGTYAANASVLNNKLSKFFSELLRLVCGGNSCSKICSSVEPKTFCVGFLKVVIGLAVAFASMLGTYAADNEKIGDFGVIDFIVLVVNMILQVGFVDDLSKLFKQMKDYLAKIIDSNEWYSKLFTVLGITCFFNISLMYFGLLGYSGMEPLGNIVFPSSSVGSKIFSVLGALLSLAGSLSFRLSIGLWLVFGAKPYSEIFFRENHGSHFAGTNRKWLMPLIKLDSTGLIDGRMSLSSSSVVLLKFMEFIIAIVSLFSFASIIVATRKTEPEYFPGYDKNSWGSLIFMGTAVVQTACANWMACRSGILTCVLGFISWIRVLKLALVNSCCHGSESAALSLDTQGECEGHGGLLEELTVDSSLSGDSSQNQFGETVKVTVTVPIGDGSDRKDATPNTVTDRFFATSVVDINNQTTANNQ